MQDPAEYARQQKIVDFDGVGKGYSAHLECYVLWMRAAGVPPWPLND